MKQIIVLVLIFLVFAGCIQPPEPEEETDTTPLEPPSEIPGAGVLDENTQTPAAPAPPINIVIANLTYDLYEDHDYNFELEVPSHWESTAEETSIKFYGPVGSDEYASSIIAQYLPAQAAGGSYKSLQELLQAYKESYEADENTELLTAFDVQQPLSGAPEGSLEAL